MAVSKDFRGHYHADRIRILGRSEAPEFESRATIFATGNNLRLVGDMVRRTVLCSLDAGVERPELRKFVFDPIERVLRQRAQYVAAAITIARGYLVAGCRPVCLPVGSYTEWSDMVRAPLIWLGQADPVASMETARLEGPELSSIRKLFLRWREELNLNGQYTTRQIIQCALKSDRPSNERADSELQDLLLRVAGDSGAINGLRLGKWLSGINCRIVDGHQLIAKRDPSLGNRFALVRM